MLIKAADDKLSRLNLLGELQNSPLLDARQKEWAEKELHCLRKGIQGERDAAHYIDSYFSDSKNYAVIHDLRLDIDGNTAQIDHLIVGRALQFYLLETKNFNANLEINEAGEFLVSYGCDRPFGIPSPVEQSRRHEVVLSKLLERLGIAGRLVSKPTFYHVVLVNTKAVIRRPNIDKFDTSNVIKADQFKTWFDKHNNKNELSTLQALRVLGAFVKNGSAELREIAEKIKRQHHPIDQLILPDFMRPQRLACAKCSGPVTSEEAKFCSDRAKRFNGLMYCITCQDEIGSQPPLSPAKQKLPRNFVHKESANARKTSMDVPEKRLICAKCSSKISFEEGKFCWKNVKRFGGSQYCRTCQAEL